MFVSSSGILTPISDPHNLLTLGTLLVITSLFREFATFLLQILFMGVYLANYIFFVIIRVIIGQFVFNVSPGEPIDFL